MISIDGGYGSGGGQILRASVALSALTRKAVHISNVRAGRKKPGLRAQHLAAVKSVAQIANAETKGLELGSRKIQFIPTEIQGGKFSFDIGTAGSTTLVLQALMPAMYFAPHPVSVKVVGGTNNPMAPPAEFVQHALLPSLRRMGCSTNLNLKRRGFYPVGGGVVEANSRPVRRIFPIELVEFGRVEKIRGLVYNSGLPSHIPKRIRESAAKTLREAGHDNCEIATEDTKPNDPRRSPSPGCGIALFASLSEGGIIAGDSLGRPGKRSEKVGREAAQDLLDQLEAECPVDRHLGDQLIVYMSVASGQSQISVTELTEHTRTCIYIAEQMVGARFKIEGKIGEPSTITCEGAWLENREAVD